jgi:hypothetical protein
MALKRRCGARVPPVVVFYPVSYLGQAAAVTYAHVSTHILQRMQRVFTDPGSLVYQAP